MQVNEVDDDGSGVIEFEEFVVLMQRFLGKDEDEDTHFSSTPIGLKC